VELLLENPSCKEGQPPDILLKSALRAEKTQNPFFLRETEFQQPAERAGSFFHGFFHASNPRFIPSPTGC
jgi:hypothetical protein